MTRRLGRALGLLVVVVTVGITTSQAIGLCMIAVGIGIFVLRRDAGVEPETPLEAED